MLMLRTSATTLAVAVLATASGLSSNLSGSWSAAPPMPVGRSAHAVAATTEAIYVLGGTDDTGTPVLDIVRFDGHTWTRDGRLPGEGLNAPAAAAIGNSIYLIGGFGTTTNRPTDKVVRYDVAQRTWREVAPLPAPRGGHAAVVMSGRIHVIGGGNSLSTIADHSVYDPATDTWAAKSPLPRSMGSPAATVLNGRLYSIGGRSGSADFGDVHVYDPAADTWTAGPSLDPRGTAGAVAIAGTLYLFGGESQAKRTVLGDVLRLDPTATQWVPDTPMPTPRNYARAVLFKGSVYTIGGSLSAGSSHASAGSRVVERFRPGSAGN